MKEIDFILAVYPTVRGYAFVLFQGPDSPFDWANRDIRLPTRNAVVMDEVTRLIARYHPSTLVLEDIRGRQARHSLRAKRLFRSLVTLAATEDLEVATYSREAIRRCFGSIGAHTKYEIAQAVARIIPAFKHRLPPVRKVWQSEDPRQSLFDAAALGITYYASLASHEPKPWFTNGLAALPGHTTSDGDMRFE